MGLHLQLGNAAGQLRTLGMQGVGIHQHPGGLHAGDDRHHRQLDLIQHLFQSRLVRQLLAKLLMQTQTDIGILGGIGPGLLQRHLGEGDLLGPLARHLLIADGRVTEIELGDAVHVMAGGDTVVDIGLEHGVAYHPIEADMVIGQHMGIVFEIVAHLAR